MDMEWTVMLEKIYLAFSRVFDGFIKFLDSFLGKEEEK